MPSLTMNVVEAGSLHLLAEWGILGATLLG